MQWSMRLIPTNKVATGNAETIQLWCKLAVEIDESDVRCRRLRHGPLASSSDKLWRAMLSYLARPADGDGRVPLEKAGRMDWSMHLSHT